MARMRLGGKVSRERLEEVLDDQFLILCSLPDNDYAYDCMYIKLDTLSTLGVISEDVYDFLSRAMNQIYADGEK